MTSLHPRSTTRAKHGRFALGTVTLALSVAAMSACAGTTTPDPTSAAPVEDGLTLILGGYKSGLQTLDYDAASGELTTIRGFEEMDPSLFAWDPVNGYLVVKCEDPERTAGYVATYRVTDDRGLERISTREVGDPSYVTVSPDGAFVIATDWMNGTVSSIPLDADGNLGEIADVVTHEGSGPYELQTSPHAHSAVFDPDGERFIVADAGNDTVYTYALDADGSISEVSRLTLPAGASPRHAVFAPDADILYVDGESSMDTMALGYDQASGDLELLQTATVLSPEDEPKIPVQWWGSSDLTISADGDTLYVANRGPDTITVFSIGADGLLTQEQIIASGGKTPRSLLLSPDGDRLLVANQNSAAVNSFAVADDGTLTDDGIVAYLNGAAAFTFAP